MPDERARCSRCGNPLNDNDTVCPTCGVIPGDAGPGYSAVLPDVPILVRTVTCPNCQATSPAGTTYCPACGRELSQPGFSATSVWPPTPQGYVAPTPLVVNLVTGNVAGDITLGIVTMIVGAVLIPFTIGIALIGMLVVYSKCYHKYPVYRRGMNYGFAAVFFLLMSPCLFCLAGSAFPWLWKHLPMPFPKFEWLF